jgi:hypothetical protein
VARTMSNSGTSINTASTSSNIANNLEAALMVTHHSSQSTWLDGDI